MRSVFSVLYVEVRICVELFSGISLLKGGKAADVAEISLQSLDASYAIAERLCAFAVALVAELSWVHFLLFFVFVDRNRCPHRSAII